MQLRLAHVGGTGFHYPATCVSPRTHVLPKLAQHNCAAKYARHAQQSAADK